MKKQTAYFLIVLMAALIWLSGNAYADAVYLKNGKVMRGKIVEKTDDYIVIKSGTGETISKNTVFSEDILRIESDEQYSQKISVVESQMGKSGFLKKAVIDEPFYSKISLPTDSGAEDIRKMIMQDRQLQASARKTGEKSIVLAASGLKSGSGSISGIVKLLEDWKEKKGPLYVYLMERTEGQGYISSGQMLYTKIQGGNIVDREVHYTIGSVPSGEYGVFAQWDVAQPLIEERNLKGQRILLNLGSKGDYGGVSAKPISLKPDENIDGVNIDCAFLSNSSSFKNQLDVDLTLSIEDVYYQRNKNQDFEFFMTVKNTSKVPSSSLSFKIYINDEDVLEEPMIFEGLVAGQEKEFNITKAYNNYKKLVEAKSGAEDVMPRTLKFKIMWVQNNTTTLEKTLFIFSKSGWYS